MLRSQILSGVPILFVVPSDTVPVNLSRNSRGRRSQAVAPGRPGTTKRKGLKHRVNYSESRYIIHNTSMVGTILVYNKANFRNSKT